MQPAFQDGVRAEAGGFARKDDKDRLRDFLGMGGNPDVTERNRIYQIDVPPDQFGKGCFRALPVVIPQQFHVAHIGHLTIYCRWPRNQTFNFSIFYCRARTRVQVLFIRKRFRCIGTALNNAARVATAHNIREMSWTAPALWRFDRESRQTNGLFYFLHHQHCDRLATRHKSEAKLFKCLVYAIQFLIFHVGFLAV